MAIDVSAVEPEYDFGGARFDLGDPRDREIVRFMLSQALYGEATGVYCGKSLYAAHSLEAAKFYLRQAKQELAHLELFGEVFRLLDLEPGPPHWVIKLLSSHNNYYPLKVLMEHAIGEGMVLAIFRDVVIQTLPETDNTRAILKKLRVVCAEEIEHVQWGEKETGRLLAASPWLATPFYGLVELQLSLLPFVTRAFRSRTADHPVLRHLEPFSAHVRDGVIAQAQALGFYPKERPNFFRRAWAMTFGALLFVRSQFARSHSTLDKTYLTELGFGGSPPPAAPLDAPAVAK